MKRCSALPRPSPPPAAADAESSSEPAALPRAKSHRRPTSPPTRTAPPKDKDPSRAVSPRHPYRPPPAPGNRHRPFIAGHAALPPPAGPEACSTPSGTPRPMAAVGPALPLGNPSRHSPQTPSGRAAPPEHPADCCTHPLRTKPPEPPRREGPPRNSIRRRSGRSGTRASTNWKSGPYPGAIFPGGTTRCRFSIAHLDAAKNRPDAHRQTATAGVAGRTRPPPLPEEDRNDSPRAPTALGQNQRREGERRGPREQIGA